MIRHPEKPVGVIDDRDICLLLALPVYELNGERLGTGVPKTFRQAVKFFLRIPILERHLIFEMQNSFEFPFQIILQGITYSESTDNQYAAACDSGDRHQASCFVSADVSQIPSC